MGRIIAVRGVRRERHGEAKKQTDIQLGAKKFMHPQVSILEQKMLQTVGMFCIFPSEQDLNIPSFYSAAAEQIFEIFSNSETGRLKIA